MKQFQNVKILILSIEAIKDDNDDDENADNGREYKKKEPSEEIKEAKEGIFSSFFLAKLLEGTSQIFPNTLLTNFLSWIINTQFLEH